MKPFNNENHIVSMEKLISLQEARSKGLEIRKSIIGDSKKIRQVWNMVETFALSDVTILLEGETGDERQKEWFLLSYRLFLSTRNTLRERNIWLRERNVYWCN